MMKANLIYDAIGRAFGREKIRNLEDFLSRGGFRITPERFAGIYVISAILISILVAFLFSTVTVLRAYVFKFCLITLKPLLLFTPLFVPVFTIIMSFIFVFSFIALIGYVLVIFAADRRREQVEKDLPDFLVLAAANARAGMTVDQALWQAAKPEFGLLSDEVEVVAKRTFGGVPFAEAIGHLTEAIDSKIVRRTVTLIKQGLASGSKIAIILERTAQDARDMQIIKQEISASLLMYVIFIVFAAAFGTPFLFGVSAKLVFMMEGVFSQIPDAEMQGGFTSTFIQPQTPIVSSEQFTVFVMISLLITSISSSLLIGIIRKGNQREGIKYLPFILAVGCVIFFVVIEVVGKFVSGMGGM